MKDDQGNDIWEKRAKLGIYYRGLMSLAYASDMLTNLQAEVVYEGDEFSYTRDQDGPKFSHTPCKRVKNRGNMIGAYCFAKFKKHGAYFDFLTDEDINKVKTFILNQQKKPRNAGVNWKPQLSMAWTYWEPEKWKITAIRRASKQWPKDKALLNTLAVVDRIDDEIQFDSSGEIQTPEEEYVCITQAQIDELHNMVLMLYPGDDRKAVAWLAQLAQKIMGEESSIQALPQDMFDQAKKMITDRIMKIQSKDAPEEPPTEEETDESEPADG